MRDTGPAGRQSRQSRWALGAALAVACAGEAEAPPAATPEASVVESNHPDVILITIDTLRADRVGAYGDPLAATPQLDALARRALLFREAHAVAPLTLPSHATLLTGRAPSTHGLRDNGAVPLGDQVPTLAAALKGGGYQTGAFVSAWVLDAAWGLDRGFDVYRSPFHPEEVARAGHAGELELPAAEVVNAAVAWWEAAGRAPSPGAPVAPRFLWVHLFEPHAPWPTAPGDPYRADVSRADARLERLLRAVGPDAAVLLTADHGEGLWSEGERHHGLLLGRAITRVPMLLRPPGGIAGPPVAPPPRPGLPTAGRPPGADAAMDLEPVPDAPVAAAVEELPVSGLDVAATLAGLAGVPFATEGLDLSPLLDGGPAADQTRAALRARPVVAETLYPLLHLGAAPLWMAQDDAHRLISGVYDHSCAWVGDPGCATATDSPAALTAALSPHRAAPLPLPGQLDAATAARLSALGYLSAPPPPGAVSGEDPRQLVEALQQVAAAEAMVDARARAEALRALIAARPGLVDARLALSRAELEQGRLPEARRVLDELLGRWPDHMTALNNAAALAHLARDGEPALAWAGRMMALNPTDPRGYRLAVAVHVERDDTAAVREVAGRGVQMAPDDPNLRYLLGIAEVQGGDPRAALVHLQHARAVGTKATDVDLWLGLAAEKAGDIDAAVRHYEAATRTMDGDLRPWGMAGVMLAKADRCREALPYLENVARRGGAAHPEVRSARERCAPKPAAP